MPDAQTSFTQDIPNRLEKNADKAKSIGAVFVFNITGDGGGTWTVNCKDDIGVTEGDAGNADCTIEIAAPDWQTMSDNPSTGMQLFFQGKLKVSGNQMLATKLQGILQD